MRVRTQVVQSRVCEQDDGKCRDMLSDMVEFRGRERRVPAYVYEDLDTAIELE